LRARRGNPDTFAVIASEARQSSHLRPKAFFNSLDRHAALAMTGQRPFLIRWIATFAVIARSAATWQSRHLRRHCERGAAIQTPSPSLRARRGNPDTFAVIASEARQSSHLWPKAFFNPLDRHALACPELAEGLAMTSVWQTRLRVAARRVLSVY